jgi:hypothetical protein
VAGEPAHLDQVIGKGAKEVDEGKKISTVTFRWAASRPKAREWLQWAGSEGKGSSYPPDFKRQCNEAFAWGEAQASADHENGTATTSAVAMPQVKRDSDDRPKVGHKLYLFTKTAEATKPELSRADLNANALAFQNLMGEGKVNEAKSHEAIMSGQGFFTDPQEVARIFAPKQAEPLPEAEVKKRALVKTTGGKYPGLSAMEIAAKSPEFVKTILDGGKLDAELSQVYSYCLRVAQKVTAPAAAPGLKDKLKAKAAKGEADESKRQELITQIVAAGEAAELSLQALEEVARDEYGKSMNEMSVDDLTKLLDALK